MKTCSPTWAPCGISVSPTVGTLQLIHKVVQDPQMRWIGPEKGLIHLATAAVDNAIWDMYAKSRGKPLWQLVADFTPEECVETFYSRRCLSSLSNDQICPFDGVEIRS